MEGESEEVDECAVEEEAEHEDGSRDAFFLNRWEDTNLGRKELKLYMISTMKNSEST